MLMADLLRKNERIYMNMTWQMYLLDIAANRKFRLLKISYISFLVGLTVSTIILLIEIVVYHTIDLVDIKNFLRSGPIQLNSLR